MRARGKPECGQGKQRVLKKEGAIADRPRGERFSSGAKIKHCVLNYRPFYPAFSGIDRCYCLLYNSFFFFFFFFRFYSNILLKGVIK